jgi:iron(III) transport system substrate-binding protein
MHLIKKIAVVVAAGTALGLVGCSSTPTESPAETTSASGLVEALGGQDQYDKLMALYEEAVEAGQTKVTVYGPEAAQQTPVLEEAWAQAFPKITLEGVQITGAQAAERFRGEAATGQGVGDVFVGGPGPALQPPNLDFFVDLETFAGSEIGDEWRGPKGLVTVGLTPFSIVYNTNAVKKSDVPTNWDDVLDSDWADRLSVQDPSTSIGLDTINSLFHNEIWTEKSVTALAANTPTIVPMTNFNGALTNVAQGMSDAAFWVSIPQIQTAIDSGAPVAYAFPMEKNNVVAREMIGLLGSSPSPLAGELYANWRLTKAGGDALASYGMYSLVEGVKGPKGLPAIDSIDLLPAVPFVELMDGFTQRVPLIKKAFGL